jgi:hypothetical protein
MSVKNSVTASSSSAPAIQAALISTVVGAAISLIVLFQLFPSSIGSPPTSRALDLRVVGGILWDAATGADCNFSQKWVDVDCRLASLQSFSRLMAASETFRWSVMTLVVTAMGAALIAFSDTYARTPKREFTQTKKGRRPLFDFDGRASLRRRIASSGSPDEDNLWLVPHVRLNVASERSNMLAVGTQGAGKTSLLRALLEQCVARRDRLFVHDFKGDMTAGFPTNRFVLVAPHDARSWAYDIADDVETRQAALEFAGYVIPKAAHDPVWADGARAILADLVMALHRERGSHWSWPDLAATLLCSGDEIRSTLERHGATSATGLILGRGDPEENRTVMSLLVTLWIAATTFVQPLADAWAHVPEGRRFSFQRWLDGDVALPTTIIFQQSSALPELSRSLGGFLVDRLAGLITAPDRGRGMNERLVLCLDELPALGRLGRLPTLLNTGREFGLVTLAGLQDFPHLAEIYGEHLADVILARFGIKVVHQLTAGATASKIEALIGTRTVVDKRPARRTATSTSVEDSVTASAPVFSTEQLEDELGVRWVKGKQTARAVVLGLGDPAVVDIPLTKWPQRRPAHAPAVRRRRTTDREAMGLGAANPKP